jgi:hypothetical protein
VGTTLHDGTGQGMTSLFAITAKPPALRLIVGSGGTVTFTVSFANPPPAATVPFPAHANLVPQDAVVAPWLALDGPPGRHFAPNSTEVYTVKVAAPANAMPGTTAFRLDMIGDENPDEQYTQGPSVALEIEAAPIPKKKPPFWLWIAIAAAVLVIGGTALTFALTRGGQTPTPTPDTTPLTVSGVNFQPVDKNNVQITFTLSKPGTARIRYATSADLTNGTTVDAAVTSGNAMQATFGINRETQYFYQITATDRSGNNLTTLVKQVKIVRTFTITLTTVTLKRNHATAAVVSLFSYDLKQPPPSCRPTYTFTGSIGFGGGTPDAATFAFPGEAAPTVPKVYTVNHIETVQEDPARGLTLTVSGAFAQPSGAAFCKGLLDSASVTLTPAQDWGVGRTDVIAESADLLVSFSIKDELKSQFSA